MNVYAELVDEERQDNGWQEWTVISADDWGRVCISHQYVKPGETERKTWCDEGSSFSVRHIDAVIAALQAIKASVPGDDADG
jgi:hypothetical protein